MLTADLLRHRREFARAVRNNNYETTDAGVFFPKQKAVVGGDFEVWVNGKEHQVAPNLIPTEGRNHILSVVCKGGSQVATWYILPFSGDYTPVAGVTAATITAAATEFTGYDESTRVAWDEGAVASGSLSNSASKANFTVSAATSATLYGVAVSSASAKSATTGTLLAATRFGSSIPVSEGYVLAVQYTLTLTSS